MYKVFVSSVIAILFAAQSAIANAPIFIGKTQISISSNQDKVVIVEMKDLGRSPITLAIKDENGNVLEENVTKGNSNQVFRFNLASLPEGTYHLSLNSAITEKVQPIQLCKNCVLVDNARLVEKYKPSFKFENKKLSISLLNQAQLPVTVKFMNEEGEKVMQDVSESGLAYGRRFDLSKLEEGTYFVSVKLNDATYYYTVNL